MNFLLGFLLIITAFCMILIVLLQRGRGGGLAGEFGGMGGQSAFGTKAGDLFTKITIGIATFWILLCVISFKVMSNTSSGFESDKAKTNTENLPPIEGKGATGRKGESPTGATGESKPAEKSDAGAKSGESAGGGAKSSAPSSGASGAGNHSSGGGK